MRFRTTTVAVLSGAVALSAFAAPAAQAAGSKTKVTKVVVNGGKDIVVGTGKKKVTLSVTATDPKGIYTAVAFLWHGSSVKKADGALLGTDLYAKCKKVNKTTKTCTTTLEVDPYSLYANKLAGAWKVSVAVAGNTGGYYEKSAYKTVRVKRAAKLTVNAAPEPAKKGQTLGVTGALTRANWDTKKYAGYTKQPVKLQFKKKGTKTWSTLKTVTSDSKGKLRTTVKATTSGTFRYAFAGTSTTPAVNSTGDAVVVK